MDAIQNAFEAGFKVAQSHIKHTVDNGYDLKDRSTYEEAYAAMMDYAHAWNDDSQKVVIETYERVIQMYINGEVKF